MAEYNKTDFLRFSAYSIKELITRKLSENSKFTDQIYEGSNLAILIDLVSYMYQCLIYQLNSAASESMFADTQIYENIARLCQFIGYHPRGCVPSKVNCWFDNNNEIAATKYIPIYSYVSIGTDSRGADICYSLNESVLIGTSSKVMLNMFNGKWKLYPQTFTASGTEYETFVLDQIASDSDAYKYVANDFVNVYVYDPSDGSYAKWNMDNNELFLNVKDDVYDENNERVYGNVYSSSSMFYSVSLNENKQYEIKFGNGILGKKLTAGSKVVVVYLDTNGSDGQTEYGAISKMPITKAQFIVENFLELLPDDPKRIVSQSEFTQQTSFYLPGDIYDQSSSTAFKPEQDVETVRFNAPLAFRLGNRLVTKSDYEYYIKNNPFESVLDVKCYNNFDYCAKFYQWLRNNGENGQLTKYDGIQNASHASDPRYYLNSSRFARYNYKDADPADANNIFIWTKLEQETNDQTQIISNLQKRLNDRIANMKTLTTEITIQQAIDVNFAVCAAPDVDVLRMLAGGNGQIISDSGTYIEITLDDNTLYSNAFIQNQVATIIFKYFNKTKMQLGQVVDYNDMLDDIMSITSVKKLRTVYVGDAENIVYYDGLSFASWSNSFLNQGEDLCVSNQSRSLEEFQFPKLAAGVTVNTLMNQIKIIKKSLTNVNTIKY